MGTLVFDVPMPQNRLLRYLRGLSHNPEWWKTNISSAGQWTVKYVIIFVGVADYGHGLIVNACVTVTWGCGAFGVNIWIWRHRKTRLRICTVKNAGTEVIMFTKNQGLALILSGLLGIPMPITKLILIPEGLLMNPFMFWLNDQFVFGQITLRDVLSGLQLAKRQTEKA